jgi:DNA mismatch repair protein MutS2
LKRRKGKTGELTRLQPLREEAEKARSETLSARHAADVQREEYERKLRELQRQVEAESALRDWRMKLQANDQVWSPKIGKMAKVARERNGMWQRYGNNLCD